MTESLDLVIPSIFSCRTDIPSGACPGDCTCSGEGVRPDCTCPEGIFSLGVKAVVAVAVVEVAIVVSGVVIRLCHKLTDDTVTRAHHGEVRRLEPQRLYFLTSSVPITS